jgi:Fic family protein
MGKITVGDWRKDSSGPMQVVSGPIGREKVHYEPPAAPRLRAEMRAILRWFNARDNTDPVLKAAIAHLWFVTIHPFDDGNGRMARAITDLMLARSGSRRRSGRNSVNVRRIPRCAISMTSSIAAFSPRTRQADEVPAIR